jgi:hypothetical protein
MGGGVEIPYRFPIPKAVTGKQRRATACCGVEPGILKPVYSADSYPSDSIPSRSAHSSSGVISKTASSILAWRSPRSA